MNDEQSDQPSPASAPPLSSEDVQQIIEVLSAATTAPSRRSLKIVQACGYSEVESSCTAGARLAESATSLCFGCRARVPSRTEILSLCLANRGEGGVNSERAAKGRNACTPAVVVWAYPSAY